MKNAIFFENKIKEAGYKLTKQRLVVLNVLILHENEHLTVEEILDYSKEYMENIGLATIYRVIQLFLKIDIIYKLNFDDGYYRYEIKNSFSRHRHHHLICQVCGSVFEMQDDLLEKLEDEILLTKGFKVKDHKVKFYGICQKCQRKSDDKK